MIEATIDIELGKIRSESKRTIQKTVHGPDLGVGEPYSTGLCVAKIAKLRFQQVHLEALSTKESP